MSEHEITADSPTGRDDVLLSVQGLKKHFPRTTKGLIRRPADPV
ncbi:MAG: hypothetical protein JWM76_578, partial [Pseudonocardiales bacterium]|nr:hypothetical protein [Pseudonocardiales bacterium]